MNSIEAWTQWEGAMVMLAPESFMALMRHYLTEFSTPFNKQQLIRDLKGMLTNGELRIKIRELLDQQDLRVLSAIQGLERPTLNQILLLLGDQEGFNVRERLLNLEERLLIYRSGSKEGLLYQAAPFLDDPDFTELMQQGKIFEAATAQKEARVTVWCNPVLLISFLGYTMEGRFGLTQTHKFRKKTITDWETRMGSPEGSEAILETLFQVARTLRLMTSPTVEEGTEAHWEVDDHATSALTALDFIEAQHLIWTAALGVSGRNIARAASALRGFLLSIPPLALLSEPTLLRWISYLGLEEHFPGGSGHLLSRLKALNLIEAQGEYLQINQEAQTPPSLSQVPELVSWTLQPNFEFFLPLASSLPDHFLAARMGDLHRWGHLVGYQLNKASLQRAFGRGLTAETILTILEQRVKGSLSQNIRFSIQEWEKEYRSLQLYKGLVMCVDEFRRPLIQHSQGFSTNVLKELAPGVYLIRDDGIEDWNRELQSMGLSPLPQVQSLHGNPVGPCLWEFSTWQPPEWSLKVVEETISTQVQRDQELLKDLRISLEQSDLTPTEKDDLSTLLERKLILLPHQFLTRGKVEKMEAKGLDYQGKIRLADQALKSATDLVEIILRDGQGNPIRHLIRPQRMEKEGTELYLHGLNQSTGAPARFSLGKISLLRRIRTSILG